MSDTLIAVEIDGVTGAITERELTSEEIYERETMATQAQADQEARQAEQDAKEAAKISGMNKLIALGLTEEEAGALING